MEQRYHPKIYKKAKNDHKEMSSILDKKLASNPVESKEKVVQQPSRISQVVKERCSDNLKTAVQHSSHNVGAPFFKKEVTSESSRRSKAITTHIESDESYNKEEK